MNLVGIGPVATLELGAHRRPVEVLRCRSSAPLLWWVWADMSGLNKRREMEKMEARKRDRRRRTSPALGMDARAHARKPRQR